MPDLVDYEAVCEDVSSRMEELRSATARFRDLFEEHALTPERGAVLLNECEALTRSLKKPAAAVRRASRRHPTDSARRSRPL